MNRKLQVLILIMISFSITLMPSHAQDVASDLLGRINTLRASLGLSAYSLNPALVTAAQSHAQWMVETGSVSHVQANGSRPVDRAQANGYDSAWVSENIYMGGLATADDAWNFWTNSSVHYAGLTSPNFNHIGIAMAKGEHGQAYVLVFGSSGNSDNTRSNASGNSGASGNNSNAAAAPNPAIKGNDGFGNIQYELQSGDTLGDVLLTFGYTWDDLPALMTLNNLSDADISNLKIGQIILVPPAAGTWTPTPIVEASPEVTEPASESTEAVAEDAQVVAQSTEVLAENPQATSENGEAIVEPVTFNAETTVVEGVAAPATFVVQTAAPLPTETATQQAFVINTPITAITPTAIPDSSEQETASDNPPSWLVGAVTVQVAVLVYATYELVRRWRR